jgi:Zn-dependent M28 family amino/carboxypeptidase
MDRMPMRIAKSLAVLVLVAVCADAQPAKLRVDADRLMSTVTRLADPKFEGRAAGSPGGIAARGWIAERFRAIGLEPSAAGYLVPFTFTSRSGAKGNGVNIVGVCPGKDLKLPVFVVSAHYDHLGVRDGVIYPGADDNASGIAVLLELAAYCRKNPLRRSIVFAAFDAEEGGLSGARAFVASPPIPKDRIALNVNLDMVSRSDRRELYVAGTSHTPDLKPPLDRVAATARVKMLFGHDRPDKPGDDWTTQSDHAAFHQAKIPFVYFGVEDHADYHKPTDTADKINRDFFAAAAETILDSLLALDQARQFR